MSSSSLTASSSSTDGTSSSTWSTSWGAPPPLFTSAACLEALRGLIQSPTVLSVAAEASSHPSGLSSLLAQPWLYAGGGLGNIDECTDFIIPPGSIMMNYNHHHDHSKTATPATRSSSSLSSSSRLHACLAGGVGKTARQDTIPAFASVCLPQSCTALDLAAPDFPATLLQLLDQINDDSNSNTNDNNNENVFVHNEQYRELAREYVRLQQRIYELNEFLQTGWSCGEYQVPFQSFPMGVPYRILLTTMILCTVLGTTVFRTKHPSKRKCHSTRLSNGGAQEEKHDETTTTTSTNIAPNNSQHEGIEQQEMLPLVNHNALSNQSYQRHSRIQQHAPSSSSSPSNHSGSFWSAWNAQLHWNTIFAAFTNNDDTKAKKSHNATDYNTACLDGLRVGSMLWIVFGHVMAIQSSRGGGYLNPRDFMPPTGFTNTWPGQLLFASRFAVDTFFCISGYLVVHVLWNKRDQIITPAHNNLSTTTTTTSSTHQYDSHHDGHDNQNNDHHIPAVTATNGATRPSSHRPPHAFWTRIFPGLMLHRILRILPLYIMCLGFWTQIAPHLGTKTIEDTTSGGPFWYQWQSLLQPCQDYGWTNLFFVNNFIPPNIPTTQTCFYHSWYIAVDLQLFLCLGLPLVYCYIKWGRPWGLGLTMCLMLASLMVTIYLSFARQWSINTFDGAAVARFDVEGYAKPYVRAQVYLAGMFLAMALLKSSSSLSSTQHSPSTVPTRTSWKHHALMATALLTLVLITFGTVTGAYARRPCQYQEWPDVHQCGSTWPAALTFWYAATSRLLWSLATTAIMGLCLSGHGGWVNTLLSFPIWKVLSHLTFGVYLIHPMVIFVWQLGSREKQVFRLATVGMNYLAVVVTSFSLAFVAVVVIEYPCANLSRRYLRFHDATASSSSRSTPAQAVVSEPPFSSHWPTTTNNNNTKQQFELPVSISSSSFPLLSNGFHHHHDVTPHHHPVSSDDDDDVGDDDTSKVIRRTKITTAQHDYYGSLSISFSETSPDESVASSSGGNR